jgi:hypothetical protein
MAAPPTQVEFFSTGTSHLNDTVARLGDVTDIEETFKAALAAPMAAICELKLVNPRLLDPTQEARDPSLVGRPNLPPSSLASATATGTPGGAPAPGGAAAPTPGGAAASAAPPAYASGPSPTAAKPTAAAAAAAAPAKAGPPPAAPKPVAAAAPVKKAVALYPYTSETDGDLQFDKDDVIEIVTITASQDDWWSGRLKGKEGFFPGPICSPLPLCLWRATMRCSRRAARPGQPTMCSCSDAPGARQGHGGAGGLASRGVCCSLFAVHGHTQRNNLGGSRRSGAPSLVVAPIAAAAARHHLVPAKPSVG